MYWFVAFIIIDKPELPCKANYRDYFKTQVHFCNTMNEMNESLLSLIHKLYRLIYYRDAIDPQPIDDIIPSEISKYSLLYIDNNELHKNLDLYEMKSLFSYCETIVDESALW